ncbi:primosomal protein [Microbacterium sp. PRC9]|uniref:primosomal protein n=1 Tax=Microbacterium sp. PRC9 TaxID=2962591 RepID=UPI0028824977|nr:primosomal protein [Microbacterium sp. PRC9]MDT0143967.1 primosomal protein [Microbacterium sp. PRC9]
MPEQEPRDDRRAPRERSTGKSSSAGADRKPYASRDGDRKPYAKRDGDRKPYASRDGDRKPYAKRDGDRPYAKRDGDHKPYAKRDGDHKPYAKRDGDRPYVKRDGDRPYAKRDGDHKPYAKRDGDRKPYEKRDGDRPYVKRDGDRKPYEKRDGDRPYVKRDGDRPYAQRDGDRKPYEKRDGDRPYAKRDGDHKPYAKRDGDRKPYEKRDGDRPYAKRDGDRKPYEKRDGDRPYVKRDGDRKPYEKRDGDRPYVKRDGDHKPYERSARPMRGGANRPDRAVREGEIRAVRPRHDDPVIPEDVTGRDLPPAARNELKTLSKENAEEVARHLVMASELIDEDPALAHQHALSASRRAGRIAVVRETLAITAYATGDFALALRELRTYRRISGRDDQIALMVDSERGVGRADRALEVGRAVDRSTLDTPVRVELAIAMSGARLDLGEPERALQELDIPELDPDRAFEWSPALFAARAAVLEELGRTDEAAQWQRRAVIAADAIDAASGLGDLETVFVEEVVEEDLESEAEDEAETERDTSEDLGEPEAVDEPQAVDEPEPAAEEQEEISVADEVAEILVEAGVDDATGDGEADR